LSKNALNTALYLLKFRARSLFEIQKKLVQKNFTTEQISQAIDVLCRNELLDDDKFAKMYVGDRNKLRPSGSYLLKMELKRFGIDDDLIEAVLVGQDEEELARRAIRSKSRFAEAEFEKKANFLQRRGFSMNVIMKVLKDV
jgi:regulatory protein